MLKIEKNSIRESIKIAVNAIMEGGVTAKINIKKLPGDDKVKEKEFYKFINFEGIIIYGGIEKNFNFFIAIPLTSYGESKDWSWLIANSFLSHAACIFHKDKEKIEYLFNLKVNVVDKLIKKIKLLKSEIKPY